MAACPEGRQARCRSTGRQPRSGVTSPPTLGGSIVRPGPTPRPMTTQAWSLVRRWAGSTRGLLRRRPPSLELVAAVPEIGLSSGASAGNRRPPLGCTGRRWGPGARRLRAGCALRRRGRVARGSSAQRRTGGLRGPARRSSASHGREGEWLVRVQPDGIEVTRGHEQSGPALRGSSSDLLLALWRRLPLDRLRDAGGTRRGSSASWGGGPRLVLEVLEVARRGRAPLALVLRADLLRCRTGSRPRVVSSKKLICPIFMSGIQRDRQVGDVGQARESGAPRNRGRT